MTLRLCDFIAPVLINVQESWRRDAVDEGIRERLRLVLGIQLDITGNSAGVEDELVENDGILKDADGKPLKLHRGYASNESTPYSLKDVTKTESVPLFDASTDYIGQGLHFTADKEESETDTQFLAISCIFFL